MAKERKPQQVMVRDEEPTEGGVVYITERMLAERTGTTPRMWQALRQSGGGPSFVRLSSRCIRYRLDVVQRWLDERAVSRT